MKKLEGTFQLNHNKKIHSWYPYLAGFSSDFVKNKINHYGLNSNSRIFDPFSGVGTTLVESKLNGIPSDGVEINPFVSFVANTKLEMDYEKKALLNYFDQIKKQLSDDYKKIDINNQPDLLKRVFSDLILKKLLFLKQIIYSIRNKKTKNLLLLALITILKKVSNCKNFSPYIEMKDEALTDAEVFEIFIAKANLMIEDVYTLNNRTYSKVSLGDARNLEDFNDSYYDLILTSPPYLNNWDYSWITKIELFFLDFVKDNKDVTVKLRNNLMKSSTYVLQNVPKNSNLKLPNSKVKREINTIINKLLKQRAIRSTSAKKYDIAVTEYFNDAYLMLKENYRILKNGGSCLWVVGDSALYNVHIPTDRLLGEVSSLVGFEFQGLEFLRNRRASRHNIKLRESVIKMIKTN